MRQLGHTGATQHPGCCACACEEKWIDFKSERYVLVLSHLQMVPLLHDHYGVLQSHARSLSLQMSDLQRLSTLEPAPQHSLLHVHPAMRCVLVCEVTDRQIHLLFRQI